MFNDEIQSKSNIHGIVLIVHTQHFVENWYFRAEENKLLNFIHFNFHYCFQILVFLPPSSTSPFAFLIYVP